ncbi:MAG: XdhC/CoxI family protein [Chloroflexota bacterium]|nr:XdhC/CoxI family protein [Chloroflexota bacterium]
MAGLFDTLRRCLGEQRLVALATVLTADPSGAIPVGAKLLIHPDGRAEGTFGADWLDAAVARDAVRAQRREESIRRPYDAPDAGTTGSPAPVEVFIEVFAPAPHLLLFGGDHIAIPLTRYAKELGFRVTIVDARSRFANRERFPEADEIIVAWPDKAFARLTVDQSTYIAILSHDPKLDEPATRGALRTDARYIGAIGARKTHAERRERLRREGFSDEQIDRIHGPIGLDLGGKTPAEIALSIIAEVVATRYGRSLAPVAEPPAGGEGQGTPAAREEAVEVAGD